MTPPKARCVTCNSVIWSHNPRNTTQRPKFCEDPQCRFIYKKNPVCARCHGPITLTHSAQRFHEDCAKGCHYCGAWLFRPEEEMGIKHRRQDELFPIYCSEEHRNLAWQGQPLPVCPRCLERVQQPGIEFVPDIDTRDHFSGWLDPSIYPDPYDQAAAANKQIHVQFDERATIWRNPPLYHHACRPDSPQQKKRQAEVQRHAGNEWMQWWISKHHTPYVPNHKGQPVPWTPFAEPPAPQYDDTPEFEDAPDHPTRGSWETEANILERHPDQPDDYADSILHNQDYLRRPAGGYHSPFYDEKLKGYPPLKIRRKW